MQKRTARLIARQLRALEDLQRNQLHEGGLTLDQTRQLQILSTAIEAQTKLKRLVEKDIDDKLEKMPAEKLESIAAGGK